MNNESVYTFILKGLAVTIPFSLKGYNLFVVSIFRQNKTRFSLIPPSPTCSHIFSHVPTSPHHHTTKNDTAQEVNGFIFHKMETLSTGVNVNAYNLFTNTKLKFTNTIPNERLPLLVHTTT